MFLSWFDKERGRGVTTKYIPVTTTERIKRCSGKEERRGTRRGRGGRGEGEEEEREERGRRGEEGEGKGRTRAALARHGGAQGHDVRSVLCDSFDGQLVLPQRRLLHYGNCL